MEQNVVDLDKEFADIEVTGIMHEKVEYFRKRGHIIDDQIIKDAAGERKIVLGNGKRGRGRLKGVMVAYVPEGDDVVRIGFSMCHPTDRWDYVKGVHQPGWGKWIASERAEKWRGRVNVMPFKLMKSIIDSAKEAGVKVEEAFDCSENNKPVVIPDSMLESFCIFVQRCKRYYKDKRFPVWVDKLPAS